MKWLTSDAFHLPTLTPVGDLPLTPKERIGRRRELWPDAHERIIQLQKLLRFYQQKLDDQLKEPSGVRLPWEWATIRADLEDTLREVQYEHDLEISFF